MPRFAVSGELESQPRSYPDPAGLVADLVFCHCPMSAQPLARSG